MKDLKTERPEIIALANKILELPKESQESATNEAISFLLPFFKQHQAEKSPV